MKNLLSIMVAAMFTFLCQSVLAQNDMPIRYMGIENGLSNNSVTCIYQDKHGFVWAGTYDGLNRFDGYKFKVFRKSLGDSTSLINNRITALYADIKDRLWVGTKQGLCSYDNITSRFCRVRYGSFEKPDSLQPLSTPINDIRADKQGTIYIGTGGRGLMIANAGSTKAVQIVMNFEGRKVPGYHVQGCQFDEQGRLWLFVQGVGICRFNTQSREVDVVDRQIWEGSSMTVDNRGFIWVGTPQGVIGYNIATKATSFYNKQNGCLTENNIMRLYVDSRQLLWVATDGGGISRLNTQTGDATNITHNQQQNGLTSTAVTSVYEDRQGRIWLGTLRGGLNIIDPHSNRFTTVRHNPLDAGSLSNNFILSFCQNDSNSVWVGTDGGGLNYWDRTKGTFRLYDKANSNITSNFITAIKKDWQGNLWMATYGGGINRYNKATDKFEYFACRRPGASYSHPDVWTLFEDRQRNLWAGTLNGGLFKYNPEIKQFELFDDKLVNILAMAEDKEGTLWGGSYGGLVKIDRQNKKHQFIDVDNPVRAILQDKKGTIWIGTEGSGLLKLNKQNNTYSRFTDADGLSSNAVLNILEDKSGHLWLATFNGLSVFSDAEKKFTNYYQSDGLQSNQFNYNAAVALSNNQLLVGGIKGFNVFCPDSVRQESAISPLHITNINVDGRPVQELPDYITQHGSFNIEQIKLPFAKAALTVDFASLEYSAPDKISYAYYLEGWDKNWNNSGHNRTASYTRLNEGHYTLRIKATNAFGKWSSTETILQIVVLPPWYRSWWAYLLYAAIATAAIYLYVRYKKNQTSLQYEVNIARIEKEKEKELNENKLNFFTNVSHEFRTPLTLIINPLKDLLYRQNDQANSTGLNVVYRNAQRLLSLVDQLLLFRKADCEADRLRVSGINFNMLCNEVYLCFIQQAKSKSIAYHFSEAGGLLEKVYCDREKVEIALFNLVANALKYTPEGGCITMEVSAGPNHVNVMVKDNGPGIAKDAQDKIFDRFYQENSRHTKPGFGIGLYVAQSFAGLHKGEITCISEAGKGTAFKLSIPKGRSHFDNAVVFEENNNESPFLKELTAMPAVADDAVILPFVQEEDIKEEEVLLVAKDSVLGELADDAPIMLVVDDNDEIRNYIKEVFATNFVLYEAADGVKGLQLARTHLPDIIISDVVMEGGSGIELCMHLKEDESLRHIPIILLTASSAADIRLKGIELGADDYITKPFDKELLIARVNNLLQKRNSLQQYFFNEVTLQQSSLKISEEYKAFLDRCIAIVEENIENDQFSIKVLASELGISHSNLYKKVKAISGQSVSSFIRFIRLRKAASLMVNSNCNVNEAAYESGISDIKYFRKQFVKLFGMNPTDYIKKYRQPFQKKYSLNEKAVKQDG